MLRSGKRVVLYHAGLKPGGAARVLKTLREWRENSNKRAQFLFDQADVEGSIHYDGMAEAYGSAIQILEEELEK